MNTLKKYKFLLYIECCVNTGVNTEKKVDIGSAEGAQIMSMKHAHKAKNSWGSWQSPGREMFWFFDI